MFGMTIIGMALFFALGVVVALAVCAFWYRHKKTKLTKVLTFFDVQERLDGVLAKTDLDEKLVETIKDIRAKVDKII